MRRIVLRIDGVVPFALRPSLHDAGACQLDGRFWDVPWKGSEAVLARLRAEGLSVEEVEAPRREGRRIPFGALGARPWTDAEDMRQRQDERVLATERTPKERAKWAR